MPYRIFLLAAVALCASVGRAQTQPAWTQLSLSTCGVDEFLVRNEMNTALLDEELDCRLYCWESLRGTRGRASPPGPTCQACPVYRAKALNCFELRAISDKRDWARSDCRDCAYFLTWARPRRSE